MDDYSWLHVFKVIDNIPDVLSLASVSKQLWNIFKSAKLVRKNITSDTLLLCEHLTLTSNNTTINHGIYVYRDEPVQYYKFGILVYEYPTNSAIIVIYFLKRSTIYTISTSIIIYRGYVSKIIYDYIDGNCAESISNISKIPTVVSEYTFYSSNRPKCRILYTEISKTIGIKYFEQDRYLIYRILDVPVSTEDLCRIHPELISCNVVDFIALQPILECSLELNNRHYCIRRLI